MGFEVLVTCSGLSNHTIVVITTVYIRRTINAIISSSFLLEFGLLGSKPEPGVPTIMYGFSQ